MRTRDDLPRPGDWGLGAGPGGELMVGRVRAVDLAREFGTPLHVLDEARLAQTARHVRESFERAHSGRTSVHYAFKCNSVPGVIQVIRREGLKAEVMSEFELELADRLGYRGREIVVNGPAKSPAFLKRCLEKEVRFIVVDSLGELEALQQVATAARRPADVLVRINPDYTPRGMNPGAATGSRRGCAFGLDLKAGEPRRALELIRARPSLRFHGYHFHIGTGIRRPADYAAALRRLAPLLAETADRGLKVTAVDVGGGFASATTRELTGRELLLYHGLGRRPSPEGGATCGRIDDFARTITATLRSLFPGDDPPELLCEPGRSVASASQFLLLTVHRVKERPGLRRWVITDGGLGTVTLPTFYECHEVMLADDVRRPRTQTATIIGPVCFASDIVYRNARLPRIAPGEVIAVMDSGAYFTSLESSFGFGRPAVVAVDGSRVRLCRRGETFHDMIGRDDLFYDIPQKEVDHEIRRH
jgi:diaminopimelate decarboxylase